jgi:hypothetical protein
MKNSNFGVQLIYLFKGYLYVRYAEIISEKLRSYV